MRGEDGDDRLEKMELALSAQVEVFEFSIRVGWEDPHPFVHPLEHRVADGKVRRVVLADECVGEFEEVSRQTSCEEWRVCFQLLQKTRARRSGRRTGEWNVGVRVDQALPLLPAEQKCDEVDGRGSVAERLW